MWKKFGPQSKQDWMEIMLSIFVLTSLFWLFIGPRNPVSEGRFDAFFTVYSALIGLLAIWEKRSGKGKWIEVVLTFLQYYGYGAFYGGTMVKGFDQHLYALFVTVFWVLYNGGGGFEGWKSFPKSLWASAKTLKFVQTWTNPKPKEEKKDKPKDDKSKDPKGNAQQQNPSQPKPGDKLNANSPQAQSQTPAQQPSQQQNPQKGNAQPQIASQKP